MVNVFTRKSMKSEYRRIFHVLWGSLPFGSSPHSSMRHSISCIRLILQKLYSWFYSPTSSLIDIGRVHRLVKKKKKSIKSILWDRKGKERIVRKDALLGYRGETTLQMSSIKSFLLGKAGLPSSLVLLLCSGLRTPSKQEGKPEALVLGPGPSRILWSSTMGTPRDCKGNLSPAL